MQELCRGWGGDWGFGIGDWGLGIGDWGLGQVVAFAFTGLACSSRSRDEARHARVRDAAESRIPNPESRLLQPTAPTNLRRLSSGTSE
ncbi:hypothetical protein FF950_20040 [Pseudoxanthomonas sp. X-1]|nr:hypothetical protein FF950_20040 [Pseudoxanthomonas sp. X-1]